MRKSKVKTLTGVIITMGVVLVATGTAIVLLKGALDKNKELYQQASDQITNNTRTVYTAIAKTDDGDPSFLPSGTVLEEGVNVEKISVSSSCPEYVFMTDEDLGKPLITNVEDGTAIYHNMVAQDNAKEGDRDYEVMVANLMESQENYDYVDVRIMYPNGEDYCVLSKKRVDNLNLESSTFTSLLNEEEILRLASATVDAYTMSGSYIYTDRYADGTISEETIPTYLVKSETKALMESDPNILTQAQETLNMQARKSLETRLATLYKSQLEAVVAGHGIEDMSDATVILDGSKSLEEESDGTAKEIVTDNVTERDWNFETTADLGIEEEAETEADSEDAE